MADQRPIYFGSCLRDWLAQDERDHGIREGLTSDERKQMAAAAGRLARQECAAAYFLCQDWALSQVRYSS